MEMRDNFDDIIRRRWEERQFPVDPLHREEMAKLLDSRKRRRALPIWWLAGLVGMAAVAILLVSRNQTPVAAHQQQAPDLAVEKTTSIPETPTHNQTHAAPQREEFEASSTANLSSASTDTPEKSTLTTTGGVSGIQATNKSSTHDLKNTRKANTTAETMQGKVTKKSNSLTDPKRRPDMAMEKPLPVQDQPAFEGEKSTPVMTAMTAAESNKLEETPASTFLPATRSDAMTPLLDPLDISGVEWSSAAGVGPIDPRSTYRRPVYLLGEIGGGLVFGSQPEYTAGWKINVGAGLGYDASSKLNVRWTAGYLMQQGGFDFERTSTVQQAGFGARSSFNTLTPERLHHVYTRLGGQYRIHRHTLHGYLGAQWLYGAQGRVSIQVQDQFTGTQESSEYAWLTLNGLKRLRWNTGLAYGYQLTPRLLVMAGTEIQLSGLTVEDPALREEGYYWKGDLSTFHPFINFNYILYGKR